MVIKPSQINEPVCRDLLFYWRNSHDVNLVLARKNPAQKRHYLKQAEYCRKRVKEITGLLIFKKNAPIYRPIKKIKRSHENTII